MQTNQFLLYGANGYTGRLIAGLASTFNLNPILAGRNKIAIQQLSKELRLPYRIVDLNDAAGLQNTLADIKLVLHAAGPFQVTAKPMMDACLRSNTHYIDITGEIPVFEMAKRYNDAAIAAGTMMMPGVGFDVLPTDCLALFLKNNLPDATQLQLAFATVGGKLSHGTAATMAIGLGEPGASRKNGVIIQEPVGHRGRWGDFSIVPEKENRLFVMSIPWGDISTAYFTTGIPNIETYIGTSPKMYKVLKLQGAFNWLLRNTLVRSYIAKRIDKRITGPADEVRQHSYSMIWGQVQNNKGESAEATMHLKDGYSLTAYSSLLVAQKILAGNFKPGFQTPAAMYGEDLVLEVPGTKRTPAFFKQGFS